MCYAPWAPLKPRTKTENQKQTFHAFFWFIHFMDDGGFFLVVISVISVTPIVLYLAIYCIDYWFSSSINEQTTFISILSFSTFPVLLWFSIWIHLIRTIRHKLCTVSSINHSYLKMTLYISCDRCNESLFSGFDFCGLCFLHDNIFILSIKVYHSFFDIYNVWSVQGSKLIRSAIS